jgi:hypothetical protein
MATVVSLSTELKSCHYLKAIHNCSTTSKDEGSFLLSVTVIYRYMQRKNVFINERIS